MRMRDVSKILDENVLEYAEDSADIFLEEYVEFNGFEDDDEIKGYKEKYNKTKKLIQKLAKYAQDVEKRHDEVIDSVDEIHEAVISVVYDYELAKSIGE